MEYEKFVDYLKSQLELDMCDQDVTAERTMINKLNQDRDVLALRNPDSCITPVVYLDDAYYCYQHGDSVVAISRDIAEGIRQTTPDLPDFTAAEAKEHLYCMVINAEDNAEWLSHSPHEQMQDLAVIAYYRLDESATIRVTDEMCPYLQMTGEEVLENAHKNTNKQEYRLETLADVLDRMIPYNIQEPNEMEEKAYVLTNSNNAFGAALITNPDVMDHAREVIGEDYYIAPSSIHETILVPKSMVDDPKELEDIIKEVNRSAVRRDEQLSDHAYYYNSQDRKIELVTKPEQEKSEYQRQSNDRNR